tara:strand:+ start:14 stop:199 length:186 start_codon:yes stop_codon:yes gene_type:complete
MMGIFQYVEMVSVIIACASSLAAMTPTPKDDEMVGLVGKVWSKLYKVVDILALNIFRAKDK